IVDLFGLYGDSGAGYTPITPTRFVDTRAGATDSALHGQVQPDVPVKFTVAGIDGVPGSATAVSFNLTAVGPVGDGSVGAFPCGAAPALVSIVDALAGTTVATNVVVALDDGGNVCLVASAPVDVPVDVTGSFGSSGAKYVASRP